MEGNGVFQAGDIDAGQFASPEIALINPIKLSLLTFLRQGFYPTNMIFT